MASVGIIANPAAGKDIRRLVAHGRFVPNHEKVNILKRILVGLDAAGVERVIMMPDASMLGRGALDGAKLKLEVEFVKMTVFNEERDSTRAAELMAEAGVGCLITLGGDGTNRSVAKGSKEVPLLPVSTGTNNVFPVMIEGTVAGMAAGVVAQGFVAGKRGDTEGRSRHVVNGEVALAGLVRQVAYGLRDGQQVLPVGLLDHRHYHAVRHCHGNADVELLHQPYLVVNQRGVQAWMLL